MNAANITHGLKLVGGNTRMWVGVLVIALLAAAVLNYLASERMRHSNKGQLFCQ
jgi:hypothetical protein